MSGTPFPVDPVLTGIAIAYRNAEYIADRVFPRLAPAFDREDFKYKRFDFSQAITQTDTRVNRKGTPNEVEFGYEDVAAFTEDFGLDDVIPNKDITQGLAQGFDAKGHSSEMLTDLIMLDREVRAANITFSPNTYAATNKETLAGSSQWSDVSSTPTEDVQDAMDSMIMRPNIAVLGRATWTQVRRHPKIVSAISTSGTQNGVATLQAVADLWELEEILVGSTWLNSAKPGQAAVRVRAWGKHAALIRRDKLASSTGKIATFGWTAEHGTRVSGDISEPKTGLRGSVRVRVGESVKEVVSAPDLGYLFNNAVA